jgi:hypothetical protein
MIWRGKNGLECRGSGCGKKIEVKEEESDAWKKKEMNKEEADADAGSKSYLTKRKQCGED